MGEVTSKRSSFSHHVTDVRTANASRRACGAMAMMTAVMIQMRCIVRMTRARNSDAVTTAGVFLSSKY